MDALCRDDAQRHTSHHQQDTFQAIARAIMKQSDFSTDNVPLLAGLAASTRADLLRQSIVHTVEAGTVLFEQGDTPTFQHVLLSGSVHLMGRSGQHKAVLIEALEPPDLLTPAAVVTGVPYLLAARVPETSRLLLIQADAFRQAVLDQPLLAQHVMGSLSGQFRRMLRQIKNLKLRTTFERVGCYLIALAVRQQSGSRVRLPYEKNLIASELGMTPESFSRALQALQREGIEVDGDRIIIKDIGRLALVVGIDPLIDDAEISKSLARLARKSKVASTPATRRRR